MYKKIYLVLILLIPHLVQAQISEDGFKKLKTLLTPNENEAWKTIPWKLFVLDAQKSAVENKKPIFIWAMDGHPLACV